MQNRTHHSPVRRLLKPMERRLWQPLSCSCGNSSSKPAPAVQAGGSHLAQITGTWGIYSKSWTSPSANHHLQSTTVTTTSPLRERDSPVEALNFTLKKKKKYEKHLQFSQKRRAEAEQGGPRAGNGVAPAPPLNSEVAHPALHPCGARLAVVNSPSEKHNGSFNQRIWPSKTGPRHPQGHTTPQNPWG